MRVFITGGGSGIGRQTALQLAEDGHMVTVYDAAAGSIASLAATIEGIVGDVTDHRELGSAIADREIDVLITSAGVLHFGAVEDMELETFRQEIEVNYIGTLAAVKAAIPALKKSRGRIVMTSSVAGQVTMPYNSSYAATKHALEALGDALRLELASDGIETVIVEPGPVFTGFNEGGIAYLRRFLPDSPHAGSYRKLLKNLENERGMGGSSVEDAARVVRTAATIPRPKARYTVPRYVWPALTLKALIPTKIWDWGMKRAVVAR